MGPKFCKTYNSFVKRSFPFPLLQRAQKYIKKHVSYGLKQSGAFMAHVRVYRPIVSFPHCPILIQKNDSNNYPYYNVAL